MKKSLNVLLAIPLLFLFIGCSSSNQMALNSNYNADFETSKTICTNTSTLSLYTSDEIHAILLREAKNEILFEFLNDNSASHNSYGDLSISNAIEITREEFDMTDDFTNYCIEVDARILNTKAIFEQMETEDFCQNYMANNL